MLGSVSMLRGAVIVPDGRYEITTYSCCIDAERGIYYYTTYSNHQITAVSLRNVNLKCSKLIEFPLRKEQQIFREN